MPERCRWPATETVEGCRTSAGACSNAAVRAELRAGVGQALTNGRRWVQSPLALGWGSARAGDAPQADPALQAAIAGPQRTPAYVARDGWRHPYETLRFFGIRPTATVVEINPGSGWYTEILAPYLREQGLLILAGPDARSPVDYRRRGAERLQQKLQAQPLWHRQVL